MNKAHFFCLLVFAAFFSCKSGDETQLPEAELKVNHISVIIDDQLWNGEIGDLIRNKFASPVIGLPQEEPLFTINQYPVKLLEGFTTNSRNIIVIKKDSEKRFRIVKDEFAKRQNVIHISGRTVGEILEIIEENSALIVSTMKAAEIAETQMRMDTSLIDASRIRKKFGISIKVPSVYKYAREGENFLWLKREIISGNTSLLIYSVPIRCLGKQADPVSHIIRMRDSIGDLYIHGTVPESRMITEEAYAPYLSQTSFHGLKAYETKGTWELKNDFMSGPFINYAIKDNVNNRILVLEGFCYAPSKEKRDLMHELEAIIRSVKILNAKKKQNAAKMENKGF